jgi:hypothetical protein
VSGCHCYGARVRRITGLLSGGISVGLCAVLATACGATGHGPTTQAARNDPPVVLTPNLNAGTTGWCMVMGGQGSCPLGPTGEPIVVQRWVVTGPPPLAQGYAVTSPQTVAVSIDGGAPIPTRARPALPGGLRGVAVRVPAITRSPGEYRAPRFTALNARDEPIAQSRVGPPLFFPEVPTETVADPAHPTTGPCRLYAGTLTGLTVGGGSVITTPAAHPASVGEGLLACASTSYKLDGWPLLAGVLLNASRPGATPEALPAMHPARGHAGLFEAPGFEGNMTARRIPGGWLAVENGKGAEQRIELLERLRATVDL